VLRVSLWRHPRRPGGDQYANECERVIRTVLATELQRTLDEMELTLDVASVLCPHCGNVNIFPGFSIMLMYTCRNCNEVVRLADDDPDIKRFFG
jgi:hypothetical protein